jgi:cell wall-associated NlpC family hydrolase
MKFLNTIPVISLRKEPSEKSELVSQLLFGEEYVVLDRHSDWLLVQCEHDNYEGWLSKSQHACATKNESNPLDEWLVSKPFFEINQGSAALLLPLGSSLGGLSDDISAETLEKWQESGSIGRSVGRSTDQLMKYAMMLLGSPYLWGGRNPFGYDCSGFVQVVYKMAGLALPRDASQQATVGQMIDFVDYASAADLAFFENEAGQIVHVGIIDGKGGIIHCSGFVRNDSIDAHGIFNRQWRHHTHKLRFIRRVI